MTEDERLKVQATIGQEKKSNFSKMALVLSTSRVNLPQHELGHFGHVSVSGTGIGRRNITCNGEVKVEKTDGFGQKAMISISVTVLDSQSAAIAAISRAPTLPTTPVSRSSAQAGDHRFQLLHVFHLDDYDFSALSNREAENHVLFILCTRPNGDTYIQLSFVMVLDFLQFFDF
jgi:hypothetical protein